MAPRIRRLFVANRGEIAVRVVKACQEMGIETVVGVSDADRDTEAGHMANRTVCIGASPARTSYLNREAIVSAALGSRSEAVHPGYGFLAEDALFAEMCREQGLTFVGPDPVHLRLFGDKVAARLAAERAGVPVSTGSSPLRDIAHAQREAIDVGFPVVLKAVNGGGGKGMRVATDVDDIQRLYYEAQAEAAAAFGEGSVFLERWMPRARHIEVQVAGDGRHAVELGVRDCSVQRRHQKLVEEAPAYGVSTGLLAEIRSAAVRLCDSVGYDSVGTVEFVVDVERNEFAFLEVNARLQVEHGVTELVTGTDIVKLQIAIAQGDPIATVQQSVPARGVAIECRINAEDPRHSFRPSPGRITEWTMPQGKHIRVDTYCREGSVVPPFYDSLIAKIMVWGENREEAVRRMQEALSEIRVGGIKTTVELLGEIVRSQVYESGQAYTSWLDGPEGRALLGDSEFVATSR